MTSGKRSNLLLYDLHVKELRLGEDKTCGYFTCLKGQI